MTTSRLILVIDDDEAIQTFVSMSLSNEGYDVLVASDGQVGLEMIHQHLPDLILLDMRMPNMDGRAFMEAYHRTPEPLAPVIVLTAGRYNTADTLPTHVAGFLAKPFALDELLTLVSRYTS